MASTEPFVRFFRQIFKIWLSEIQRLFKIDSTRPASSSHLHSANCRNSINLIKFMNRLKLILSDFDHVFWGIIKFVSFYLGMSEQLFSEWSQNDVSKDNASKESWMMTLHEGRSHTSSTRRPSSRSLVRDGSTEGCDWLTRFFPFPGAQYLCMAPPLARIPPRRRTFAKLRAQVTPEVEFRPSAIKIRVKRYLPDCEIKSMSLMAWTEAIAD
jgi:hypothetical protein